MSSVSERAEHVVVTVCPPPTTGAPPPVNAPELEQSDNGKSNHSIFSGGHVSSMRHWPSFL